MEIEHLEITLNRVQDWIKSVDQKISIFLVFQVTIFSLLFSKINLEYLKDIGRPCVLLMNIVVIEVSMFLLIYSLYKSISCIIPRIGNKSSGESVIYFGDISSYNLIDYKKLINKTKIKDYKNELINQIHITSIISNRKHILLRDAIVTFIIGIVALSLYLFLVKLYGI